MYTDTKYLKTLYWGKIYHASVDTKSKEVMLGFSQGMQWKASHSTTDDRYIILHCSFLGLEIIRIHDPNNNLAVFWNKVLVSLQNINSNHI